MPSLKDLRMRIDSVKSTQKITSAMKMVAAAKLRRAQEQAEAARPYAERMERMLGSLASSMVSTEGASPLLAGTGKQDTHLLVIMTSDRGLCGAFNSSIVREARKMISELRADGSDVKVLCVGRKGWAQLRRDYASVIVDLIEDVGRQRLGFDDAQGVANRVLEMFEAGEFDVCTLVYNTFQSAISQIVTRQQLIPFAVDEATLVQELLRPPKSPCRGQSSGGRRCPEIASPQFFVAERIEPSDPPATTLPVLFLDGSFAPVIEVVPQVLVVKTVVGWYLSIRCRE